MNNQDIREAIKENCVKYWQIADKLGMTDGNFSRLLRHELSEDKKAQIRSAIAALKEGGK